MITQYRRAINWNLYCLNGDDQYAKQRGGDLMWLMGYADSHVEIYILEELMLESMEGLS